jgi:predicted Rossmann fold nucleotide-binding protein DprA/Smf involved in DNA uptake
MAAGPAHFATPVREEAHDVDDGPLFDGLQKPKSYPQPARPGLPKVTKPSRPHSSDSLGGTTPVHSAQPTGEPASLIIAMLSPSPTAIDDIVRETGLPTAIVQAALMELELDGRIVRASGGMITLTP